MGSTYRSEDNGIQGLGGDGTEDPIPAAVSYPHRNAADWTRQHQPHLPGLPECGGERRPPQAQAAVWKPPPTVPDLPGASDRLRDPDGTGGGCGGTGVLPVCFVSFGRSGCIVSCLNSSLSITKITMKCCICVICVICVTFVLQNSIKFWVHSPVLLWVPVLCASSVSLGFLHYQICCCCQVKILNCRTQHIVYQMIHFTMLTADVSQWLGDNVFFSVMIDRMHTSPIFFMIKQSV